MSSKYEFLKKKKGEAALLSAETAKGILEGEITEPVVVEPIKLGKEEISETRAKTKKGKRHDPNYCSLMVYVPIELHSKVRSKLFLQRKQLSHLVTELLEEWLDEQPQ